MILKRTAAFAAALALLTAACGDDDGDDSAQTTDAPADTDSAAPTVQPAAEPAAEPAVEPAAEPAVEPAVEPAAGAVIGLAAGDLGEFVADADGNTLYLFVPDGQGDSTCYDQCEENWPPIGEVSDVGDGLDAGLLGTTERTNGDVQATYNGWPLYYFANDSVAGDTNGQGVGDVWYVVAASGDAIDGGAGAVIGLAAGDLGEFVADADGNTLYLFVPDGQGDSTCYDQCEENWPPIGEVSDVGDGLDAGLLGTTERTNGDVQATYNGWPLYYFANDSVAGDTNGQGVGDVWYVVAASGDAIDG